MLSTLDPAFEFYVKDQPGLSYEDPTSKWLVRMITRHLESLMGRPKLEGLYHRIKAQTPDARSFFKEALSASDIRINVDKTPLQQVDPAQPVLFIANHPFGVIDGLIMCNLALELAGNFRVVINSLLCQDRELAEHFLPIDFSGTKDAAKRNIRAKQLAHEALENRIPLILFPSGMVSTANQMGFGKVYDAPWSTFVAKLVTKSQPTIVPVYFEGQNSRPFHLASHIAEPLRMAMLLREALKRFGSEINLTIGQPMQSQDYCHQVTRHNLTQRLYEQVQSLAPKRL
ncbi:MAG: lysophospholipid acyltransferase family protein [Halieaceae bacterium]|nr:lysophospholipid acyltransferase family protein [Halieaceae bacterium]